MIVFFAKYLVYVVLNWLVTFDVFKCDIHCSYPPRLSTKLKKKKTKNKKQKTKKVKRLVSPILNKVIYNLNAPLWFKSPSPNYRI